MRIFQPILAGASLTERMLACVGACIGIGLTMLICSVVPGLQDALPVIVAPIGASAVLVFAVPASPLAQPWPVIGGNTISTLVGVTMFRLIPDATLAAAMAVGGAILVMSLLRCLHPPGGAAALTAVIGGSSVHLAGFGFAFVPVCINSIALVGIAVAFHRIGVHSYPHVPAKMPAAPGPPRFAPADVDAALKDMHESFDISREDIDVLLGNVERHAAARSPGKSVAR